MFGCVCGFSVNSYGLHMNLYVFVWICNEFTYYLHVAVLLQALKKSSRVIESKVGFMEDRTRAWSKDGPYWLSTNRLREKKTFNVAIEHFATDRKLKLQHLED